MGRRKWRLELHSFSAPEEGCGVGHVDLYLHVPGKFNLSAHWLLDFSYFFKECRHLVGRLTSSRFERCPWSRESRSDLGVLGMSGPCTCDRCVIEGRRE